MKIYSSGSVNITSKRLITKLGLQASVRTIELSVVLSVFHSLFAQLDTNHLPDPLETLKTGIQFTLSNVNHPSNDMVMMNNVKGYLCQG